MFVWFYRRCHNYKQNHQFKWSGAHLYIDKKVFIYLFIHLFIYQFIFWYSVNFIELWTEHFFGSRLFSFLYLTSMIFPMQVFFFFIERINFLYNVNLPHYWAGIYFYITRHTKIEPMTSMNLEFLTIIPAVPNLPL